MSRRSWQLAALRARELDEEIREHICPVPADQALQHPALWPHAAGSNPEPTGDPESAQRVYAEMFEPQNWPEAQPFPKEG